MTSVIRSTLAIAMLACSPAVGPSPSAQLPAVLADSLQTSLDRWAAAPGHHGVSAAVVLPDGSTWNGVSGDAGPGVPLRPEEAIWVASITKSMTGAVVLQLIDEGRLGLDDSIGPLTQAHPNVPPTITIRQLLNHTNGLANYTRSSTLNSVVSGDPDHLFSSDELMTHLGPPAFTAGGRTQYTNTSFLLLGMIAERITGEDLVELYRSRIWGPLGMEYAFVGGRESPRGPVALSRGRSGVVSPLANTALLSLGQSAFGVYATAGEIARWGDALFSGGVISDSLQSELRVLVPAAGNIPGESGAGLGIRGYNYFGRTQLGHSGGSTFGSSLMLHDPESGITVAVLINQGFGADHFALTPELLGLVASGRD